MYSTVISVCNYIYFSFNQFQGLSHHDNRRLANRLDEVGDYHIKILLPTFRTIIAC